MKTDDMKIKRGQILKELRTSRNLTQAVPAMILEISQPAYSKYEYGTAEPNCDGLCKLADFYNVTFDYLLGREPAPDVYAENGASVEEVEGVLKKLDEMPPEVQAQLVSIIKQLADAAQYQREHAESVNGIIGERNGMFPHSATIGELQAAEDDLKAKNGA